MKKLKIEAGKFYKTRDGRKAGIYRTDVNHPLYSIHGYVIAPDGIEYSRCWHSDGKYMSVGGNEENLISEWQDSLNFDWDCLPKWRNKYIAMDENGAWYAYSNEPKQGTWGFCNYAAIIEIPEEYQPKNFTGDWKDSLFKNPKLA